MGQYNRSYTLNAARTAHRGPKIDVAPVMSWQIDLLQMKSLGNAASLRPSNQLGPSQDIFKARNCFRSNAAMSTMTLSRWVSAAAAPLPSPATHLVLPGRFSI